MEKHLYVLLVDDDEDEYVLIKGLFARLPGQGSGVHYTLDWAPTYESGLKSLVEKQYDIHLVDYHLGARNGLDLLRAASSANLAGPFILMTGQGSYEVDLAAMQLGVYDYLLKDQLNEHLLERSIRYALERKQAQDELEMRVRERTHDLANANERLEQTNSELHEEMARRARAEETLRESEERFRKLAETTSAAIFIVQDLKIRYANPAARIVTGYPPEELLGTELWRLAHPNYQAPLKQDRLVRQWSELIPARYEMKIITRRGEERWVDVTAGQMQFANRPAWLITAFDITERDLAEQALRKAKDELEQRVAERTTEIQATSQRMQTVLRTLPVAIMMVDRTGQLLESNQGFEKLWDLPGPLPERVLDIDGLLAWRAETGEPVTAVEWPIARAVQNRETVLDEVFDILTVSGLRKTIIISAVPILDATGEQVGALSVAQDITHQRRLEQHAQAAAREAQQRADELDGLHRATAALLSTLDLDQLLCQILDAAQSAIPAAERGMLHIVSRSTGQLQMRATLGFSTQRIRLMQSPMSHEYPARVVHERRPMLVEDAQVEGVVVGDPEETRDVRSMILAPLIYGDQVLGAIALSSTRPAAFTEGNLRLLVSFATTITAAVQNALLHGEVKQLATSDPLTGQYNRRAFFDLGQRELERFLRFNHPLSVVMIDLDNLKQINDTYGHGAGDQVLRALARHFAGSIRETDIFGRYGGDEFALLLPDTDLFTARHIANRIREIVQQNPCVTDGAIIPVSISMGVAEAQKKHNSLEELLADADRALYQAKAAGRNRVEVFQS